MTASRSAVVQDVRLSTEKARFSPARHVEGYPLFLSPKDAERNSKNAFFHTQGATVILYFFAGIVKNSQI